MIAKSVVREPREVQRVLATVPYQTDELAQLRRAFAPAQFVHVPAGDSTAIAAELERADVAVLEGDLDDRHLSAPHLRWVHCDHAGLTRSARPEVFERGLIVTGSAGRSGPALAQHAFYFALALCYDASGLLEMQRARVWRGLPGYEDRLALWGKTLGVVGFGHTGREMARLGKAFGMRVVVYRRKGGDAPAEADLLLSVDSGDSIDQLVEESDVIMLAVHLSDETYHLLSSAQFARMRPGAIVINMARGPVVDEAALLAALRSGQVAGAGLDVFDKEPLPASSPLWDAPNVLITPHMTPRMPDKTQRSIDTIVENLRRYRVGEPMLNAITERDIYTRGQSS